MVKGATENNYRVNLTEGTEVITANMMVLVGYLTKNLSKDVKNLYRGQQILLEDNA